MADKDEELLHQIKSGQAASVPNVGEKTIMMERGKERKEIPISQADSYMHPPQKSYLGGTIQTGEKPWHVYEDPNDPKTIARHKAAEADSIKPATDPIAMLPFAVAKGGLSLVDMASGVGKAGVEEVAEQAPKAYPYIRSLINAGAEEAEKDGSSALGKVVDTGLKAYKAVRAPLATLGVSQLVPGVKQAESYAYNAGKTVLGAGLGQVEQWVSPSAKPQPTPSQQQVQDNRVDELIKQANSK